jgi:hypothetical protein
MRWKRRLSRQSSPYQQMRGGSQVFDHGRRQLGFASGTSLLYKRVADKQRLFELSCPQLLLVLVEKAQFSKNMCIAQSVLTLAVSGIAAVTVMFHRATKLREDADCISARL